MSDPLADLLQIGLLLALLAVSYGPLGSYLAWLAACQRLLPRASLVLKIPTEKTRLTAGLFCRLRVFGDRRYRHSRTSTKWPATAAAAAMAGDTRWVRPL